tara:strand:- start:28686 stop:29321 length:636 start_codon:yes stop_codon:yes gene_type:complete
MISVIIRNKNEARWIGHAIQSCLDFFSDPEIIIIDNESSDDSLSVVNEFCFSNIKVHAIDQYTPGKALNFGISKASYNVVLILSAHSQIMKMPDMSEINDALKSYSAVFGKQTPVYRGKKINKRYIWSHFVDEKVENMWSELESRNFLHNAFCFYDKKALIELPFNEGVVSKEDRYWAADAVSSGMTYLYEPAMECNHHWTPGGATWKGIG